MYNGADTMKFIILLFVIYAIIQSYSYCVAAGRADKRAEEMYQKWKENKDG